MRVGIIKVTDFIDYQSYEIFNHVYVWLSSSEMFSQLTISLSLSGSSWISSLCLTIICKKYVKSAQSEDKPGGGCEAWIDIGEYEIMILSHNHIPKTQPSDLIDWILIHPCEETFIISNLNILLISEAGFGWWSIFSLQRWSFSYIPDSHPDNPVL